MSRSLRDRLLLITLAATTMLAGLLVGGIASIVELHETPLAGGCLIWLCWTSGLCLAVLFLHMVERTAASVGVGGLAVAGRA